MMFLRYNDLIEIKNERNYLVHYRPASLELDNR